MAKTAIKLLCLIIMISFPVCAAAENLVRIGGNVRVENGKEADSAVSLGGNVQIDGLIRKDAVAVGGSVYLGPNSVVRGNVVSVGGMVSRQVGSRVGGDVTVIDTSRAISFWSPPDHGWWIAPNGYQAIFSIFPFLGFLVLALIIVAIAPRMIGSISFAIEQAPARSFFLGILGSASVFPLAFMLLISIIGIILIPFEMLCFAIAFFLGYVAVSQLIGKKLFTAVKMPGRPMLLETLVGSIAVWLVSMAPFIGWLFLTCALFMGLGGVLSSIVKRMLGGRQQV